MRESHAGCPRGLQKGWCGNDLRRRGRYPHRCFIVIIAAVFVIWYIGSQKTVYDIMLFPMAGNVGAR